MFNKKLPHTVTRAAEWDKGEEITVMKKLISLALALVMMLAVLTSVVFAEGEEPTNFIELFGAFYLTAGTNANTAPQAGLSGNTAIGLKPKDEKTAEEAWFEYVFDIPADCKKVELVISYAAKGDRAMELTAFTDKNVRLDCESTGDWKTFYEMTRTYESVKKGEYTIRIAAPADFNNDTVKTPNIDLMTINMYYEDYETLPATEPVTEPATEPVTDNPQTNAPAGDATTPETTPAASEGGCGSVIGASAVIVATVASFGCALIKRH